MNILDLYRSDDSLAPQYVHGSVRHGWTCMYECTSGVGSTSWRACSLGVWWTRHNVECSLCLNPTDVYRCGNLKVHSVKLLDMDVGHVIQRCAYWWWVFGWVEGPGAMDSVLEQQVVRKQVLVVRSCVPDISNIGTQTSSIKRSHWCVTGKALLRLHESVEHVYLDRTSILLHHICLFWEFFYFFYLYIYIFIYIYIYLFSFFQIFRTGALKQRLQFFFL